MSFFVQAAGDLHETLTLDEKNVGIGSAAPSTSALQVHATKNSAGTAWTGVGPGNIASITISNDSTTDNTMAGIFLATSSTPNVRGGILMNFNDVDNESTYI